MNDDELNRIIEILEYALMSIEKEIKYEMCKPLPMEKWMTDMNNLKN